MRAILVVLFEQDGLLAAEAEGKPLS